MFLCDNITAFDIDVVPDVKSIILISVGFIGLSRNSLLPSFNNLFPFSISSSSDVKFSCLSIQIYSFIFVFPAFLIFCIISVYDSSKIIQSVLLLIKEDSTSASGNPLSSGTTIPMPFTVAKYETIHSYLFFPIIAILFPFRPRLTSSVPKLSISSPNCLYVIFLYSTSLSFLFFNINALFSGYFFTAFLITSLIVSNSVALYKFILLSSINTSTI